MSIKLVKIIVVCGLILACTSLPALAQTKMKADELYQRIGLGYNQQLSFGILGGASDDAFLNNQSFSVKYWATPLIGIEGLLGFTTAKYEDDKGTGATIGAKLHVNVIREPSMNVYSGGGVGIMPVSTDFNDDSDNNVGFMLQGFFGMEFFFQGLPNLGFDVEIGLEYVDYDEFQQFGTYGGGFGLIGVRYYF